MSPKRTEFIRRYEDGTVVKEIKESPSGFNVGPSEATKILGVSRTTLFRHDGVDVVRNQFEEKEPRVYDDISLLRISSETGKSKIRESSCGLTEIFSKKSSAILDLDWKYSSEFMDKLNRKRSVEK
jgi:hypothetical protein